MINLYQTHYMSMVDPQKIEDNISYILKQGVSFADMHSFLKKIKRPDQTICNLELEKHKKNGLRLAITIFVKEEKVKELENIEELTWDNLESYKEIKYVLYPGNSVKKAMEYHQTLEPSKFFEDNIHRIQLKCFPRADGKGDFLRFYLRKQRK